jgi:hypothetical protein
LLNVKLERLPSDKHSNLLGLFISYEENKVKGIRPQASTVTCIAKVYFNFTTEVTRVGRLPERIALRRRQNEMFAFVLCKIRKILFVLCLPNFIALCTDKR